MRKTLLMLAMVSSMGLGVAHSQEISSAESVASSYEATRADATEQISVSEPTPKDQPTTDNNSSTKAQQAENTQQQGQQPDANCWVSRTCVNP